jgi:hypothetical protein
LKPHQKDELRLLIKDWPDKRGFSGVARRWLAQVLALRR